MATAAVVLVAAGSARALLRPAPVLVRVGAPTIVDGQKHRVTIRREPGEVNVFSGPGIGPWLIVTRSVDRLVGTRDTYDELVSADPLLVRAIPGADRVPRPLSLHGPEAASTELLLRRDPRAIVTVPWAAELFGHYGLPALSLDLKGDDNAIRDAARMQSEVVGRPAHGTDLVARYDAAMAAVAASTQGLRKVGLLAIATEAGGRLVAYDRPLFPRMLERAGARDVAPRRSVPLDPERLLALDPEVIVLLPTRFTYPASPLAAFRAQPWAQGLRAVRARRVYAVPPLFVPLGSDAVQAPLYARWLAELLHPDALAPELRAQAVTTVVRELGVTPTRGEIDRALAVVANADTSGYDRFTEGAR